jgi:hypothetical protein
MACSLAVLAAALAASGGQSIPARETEPLWEASAARSSLVTDDTHVALSAAQSDVITWLGGPTQASTGETVTVYVSSALPPELGTTQTWADTFAGFVHGPELGSLVAYVTTWAEIQDICGDTYALGCYGGGELYTIGEALPWADPVEIASHEYGHHVALNRDNSPWQAIAWGTKRWATLSNVCVRAAGGSAFPGDETDHYRLNPGEGFAEAYRATNEWKQGATSFDWQIVDGSFYPTTAALQAVEQDVLEPWTQSAPNVVRARFTEKGKKTWTLAVATPLDGGLKATLSLPGTRPYTLSLLSTDGKTLATGLWSGARTQTLSFVVCGQRSLLLRVVRGGPAGTFSLAITKP